MQVTVLGKSPSWQDASGACSGYLVQQDGFTLLLDCGNGVFSKLRRIVDYLDVDAVLISHLHADHFLDLIPYSYALSNAPRRPPPSAEVGAAGRSRPVLHVPGGGADTFRRIVGCWGSRDLVDNAFAISEYSGDERLALGPLSVRFCEVPHFTVTYAVELSVNGRASAADGPARRFTFGADCRPNQQLVRFAHDTDVLMIEATLPRPEPDGVRGHLTPREAGEHGRRAAARRLVLTHFSDEMDPEWARGEAADSYGGPVELAHEGAVYTL